MKRLGVIFTFHFLFLISCSRLDLASMWADTYISEQIDQYFDVSSMQSQFVKSAVNEDIDKIRVQIFPLIAQSLTKIENLIKNNTPMTADIVSSMHTELKNIFYAGLKIFELDAQKFVKKIESKQLDRFRVEFNKKMQELQSDLETSKEAKAKRESKIKSQLKSWLGTISEDQQIDIKKFVDENPFPIKEQIKNREKLSSEFLESFPISKKTNKFITQMFTDYESMRDPGYARALKLVERKYFELIATVLNKMSVSQRQYVITILSERINQLKKSTDELKADNRLSSYQRNTPP